ncbi:MAG: hypothetical protein AAGB01_00775 [Cyanobacteria bacterium P01_F01_bin.42]
MSWRLCLNLMKIVTPRFWHRYSTLLLGWTFIVMAGCQSAPAARQARSVPRPTIQSLPPSQPPESIAKPEPIAFTVTVNSPAEELKIKSGSFIRQGDIIVSPVKKRSALVAQRQTLKLDLKTLGSATSQELGDQDEKKQLAIAEQQVATAELALVEYQRDSPWTDFARSNLPLAQEEVEINRLEQRLKQARSRLKEVQSDLTQKQVAIERLRAERAKAQRSLEQNLIAVERELAELKPLLSPHTGTVTQLDIPSQSPGKPVTVSVVMTPGEKPQPIPKPNPALTPSPASESQGAIAN